MSRFEQNCLAMDGCRVDSVSELSVFQEVKLCRHGAQSARNKGGKHSPQGNAPRREKSMSVLPDLKQALRDLRKSPGFALTAVLTLALGIGATTAIFTLVHAVLLRSLPVHDPSTLVRVGDNEQCCQNGGLPDYAEPVNDWSLFSYRQYEQFRDHTPGFSSLAAFESTDHEMAVRRSGSSEPAQPWYGEFVSGNSFETLGLRPYAGRLLQPSDDVKGAAPVAVLSFQTWEQELGRDPNVLGSSVTIDGQPVTVIGIAPPGFFSERLSPTPPALWLPIQLLPVIRPIDADLLERGGMEWLNLIGRVAPGAKPRGDPGADAGRSCGNSWKARSLNLSGLERALIPRQYLRLTPGGGGVQRMQEQYKDDLHLLMWIASFVLLIACANLANLMLARSVTKRQQIAVRTALGASRGRLVQRALVECLLLAMLGGLAGLLVAWGGARLIIHLAFQHDPISISASPSPIVMAFAFAASLLTGLLFGVAPAWLAAHADPIEALRGANRSTGRHTTFAQKTLVVAQAAVSVVLLSAAGFLILSLQKLEHQHFGFDPAHRTIVQFNAETAGLRPEELDSFYRRLNESLSSIPGVSHVAWSGWSPMDGNNRSEDVYIEGQPAPPPGSNVNLASWVRVSPDYFTTIGTKLLEGRVFSDSDNRTAANVAIVDEAFVKKYLHGQNPIGAHFGDWDQSTSRPVHHRRRRRRRAVLASERFAGERSPHVLPARVAVGASTCHHSQGLALSGVPHRHALYGFAGARNPRHGAGPRRAGAHRSPANRPRSHDHPLPELEPAGESRLQPTADDRAVDFALRIDRAGAGRYRALRSDRVCGRATHQRNRHSHGAGGQPCPCAGNGAAGRLSAGWPRAAHRPARGHRCRPSDDGRALWG